MAELEIREPNSLLPNFRSMSWYPKNRHKLEPKNPKPPEPHEAAGDWP